MCFWLIGQSDRKPTIRKLWTKPSRDFGRQKLDRVDLTFGVAHLNCALLTRLTGRDRLSFTLGHWELLARKTGCSITKGHSTSLANIPVSQHMPFQLKTFDFDESTILRLHPTEPWVYGVDNSERRAITGGAIVG